MPTGRDQRIPDISQFGASDLTAGDLLLGYDVEPGVTKATRLDTLSAALGRLAPSVGAPLNAKAAPFGAIADGASHPLSTVYPTLAAAQAVYPFVTSLTQEIDWAACQLMSNTALGWNGSEHGNANSYLNAPMILPGGSYQFGADTWLIRSGVGVSITGAGRLSTKLNGSGIVFGTDGLWFSSISGIAFTTTGAVTAVDIDGNVPGHPYATLGVQGNTFKDCWFDASGVATYAFALTRLGNPPGPGAQGSENLFLNCHFNNATTAPFYLNGYNALQNTFIGGNFQGYPVDGARIINGSATFYSVGFQSTYGYTQLQNGGWDINASSNGAHDRIIVDGCRSESMCLYNGDTVGLAAVIRGSHQEVGGTVNTWTGSHLWALNSAMMGTTASNNRRMYICTTSGTSGTSEPAWPESGTVTDGTAVWTQLDYASIVIFEGVVQDCYFGAGAQVKLTGFQAEARHNRMRRSNFLASGSVGRHVDNFWQETSYKLLDNRGGSVTFATAATATVTFANPEFDTSYTITFDAGVNETMWATNKTTAGFTAHSSNATSTATAQWSLSRA